MRIRGIRVDEADIDAAYTALGQAFAARKGVVYPSIYRGRRRGQLTDAAPLPRFRGSAQGPIHPSSIALRYPGEEAKKANERIEVAGKWGRLVRRWLACDMSALVMEVWTLPVWEERGNGAPYPTFRTMGEMHELAKAGAFGDMMKEVALGYSPRVWRLRMRRALGESALILFPRKSVPATQEQPS